MHRPDAPVRPGTVLNLYATVVPSSSICSVASDPRHRPHTSVAFSRGFNAEEPAEIQATIEEAFVRLPSQLRHSLRWIRHAHADIAVPAPGLDYGDRFARRLLHGVDYLGDRMTATSPDVERLESRHPRRQSGEMPAS